MESRATIEERLARVEDQLTALEGRSRSHRRSASGGPLADWLTRAGFLRKAGALAAGVAGAALLEARGATDAYATTTDSNFVASGLVGGGGFGFLANPPANFDEGAHLAGTGAGLSAFGLGASGAGVRATGAGGPVGGSSRPDGVVANGGTPNGVAVWATGQGPSPGVLAAGGASSGIGVQAAGGTPNGHGVSATGQGTGFGILATSAVSVGGSFSGGRAPISLSVAGSAGPPTSGLHSNGDIWADSLGTLWICTVPGTPGTFVPLQPGGLGTALFAAVSTLQNTLLNSDGVTWVDLDSTSPTPLALTVTPTFKCQAVISGNADLWTANAGYNQDLGITISGGAYPTTPGQPEAWKESGGFAGTFSPNAAFVETVVPLAAATTYTIKLQWKTNKRAGGVTIVAGAGPIGGKFSPTRLRVLLIASA